MIRRFCLQGFLIFVFVFFVCFFLQIFSLLLLTDYIGEKNKGRLRLMENGMLPGLISLMSHEMSSLMAENLLKQVLFSGQSNLSCVSISNQVLSELNAEYMECMCTQGSGVT